MGKNLVHGPKGIKFNVNDLCGSDLAPMQEGYTQNLGLDMDNMILGLENYKFESGTVLSTEFPSEGALKMVALLCALPFEYGSAFP